MAYEMYLSCRMQRDLKIAHPLAFGIYWAGTTFFLYCMEVFGGKYVPHQLLCLRSTEGIYLFILQSFRFHFSHLTYLPLRRRTCTHISSTLVSSAAHATNSKAG